MMTITRDEKFHICMKMKVGCYLRKTRELLKPIWCYKKYLPNMAVYTGTKIELFNYSM